MNSWQGLLVFAAGIAAGTINAVVGSGTLITFPVLLGIGVPPVTANVSNTLGLVPGSIAGAYGYRPELTGQGKRAITLGIGSTLGAVAGAVLLLTLPAGAFKVIVPVLIAVALVVVVFGPRLVAAITPGQHAPNSRVKPTLWLLVLCTGVYGGYFGAAQGVLLMGILGVLLDESLQRQNALKNVLAGLTNAVAAIVFVASAHIDWAAAGLIAAGSIVGGTVGAKVGRRLPPKVLRALIVAVGVVAIIKLLA
ncbi:MAG: sulfite exporter TauE/SafE family protein [Actinomycetota bacterium]|nr:sulfite exporter TauE/SafE family protein [Actinomycetota bacterium]